MTGPDDPGTTKPDWDELLAPTKTPRSEALGRRESLAGGPIYPKTAYALTEMLVRSLNARQLKQIALHLKRGGEVYLTVCFS